MNIKDVLADAERINDNCAIAQEITETCKILEKWILAEWMKEKSITTGASNEGEERYASVPILPEAFKVLREFHIDYYDRHLQALKQKLNNV